MQADDSVYAPLSTRDTILVVGAVLAQLCLTIPLAATLNTWVDESYTLRTTNGGLIAAIHQALRIELQPPLYFALLSIWRQADHSVLYARLFSVICAALTIYCAVQVGRRFAPRVQPAWIAAVFLLSPALVWAALEIRVYAFAGLLIAVLLWLFYDGYLRPMPSKRARILYIIAAISGLYTQYFIGFVLIGCWAALAAARNRWAMRRYTINACLIAVGCLPLFFFVRDQVVTGTAAYFSNETFLTIFYRFNGVWFNYVIPVAWAGSVFHALGSVKAYALGSLTGLIIAVYVRKRHHIRPEQLVLGAIVLTTCVLLLAAFTLTHEPFGTRYAFVVFVPLMLLIFASLADLPSNNRWVLGLWLVVFFVGSAGTLDKTYSHLAKHGDWKRVAHFIQMNEHPGEPILAFQAENALTLADYYTGHNTIVPIPRPIRFDSGWEENVIVQNEGEIAQALRRVPGDHSLVWSVTTHECRDFNVDYHCSIFEHYVATHFTELLRREFFGSTVRLLREKF